MRRPWSGPRRRLLVVAGLVALLQALALAAAAAPAAAHASLVSTDPAEGEVVPETPDVVTFTFDEPVSLTDTGLEVFDATGEPVEAESSSQDTEVVADLPDDLADGTYVVVYRVISADGHPVAGSLTFSIGAASETVVPPDVDPDATRPLRAAIGVGQALGYVGLLVSAGLVVFLVWVLGAARLPEDVRDRLVRLHWAATGLAVLSWAASVPLAGAYQQGLGLRGAVEPEAVDLDLVGDDLWVLAMVTSGLVAGLFAARWPTLAACGALWAVMAPPLVGHTRSFEPVGLLISTDILHLAAGAVWLGGLVGLVLTLRALARRPREVGEVLARFSTAAAVVLGLLVLSGSLLGWRIIGSWSGLLGTTYGVLLLVKVGVVAVVAGVAAWNRFGLLPRTRAAVGHGELQDAAAAVRRSVRLEAVLVVAVLAVTGFLTSQSPRDESASAVDPAASRVATGRLGDHSVLVTLAPGTRGPNTFLLQVQDAAGDPVDVYAAPEVSVSNGTVDLGRLTLVPVGAGTYAADVVFPSSGAWEAQVSVRLSEFDNPVAVVDLDVG